MTPHLTHSLITAALLLVTTACASAATAPVMVRIHSAGTAAMAASPQGTNTQSIASLPESQQLLQQTIAKLAQSSPNLFGRLVPPSSLPASSSLLTPLANDLVRSETLLEIESANGQIRSWAIAIAPPQNHTPLWHSNLAAIVKLWNLPQPTRTTLDGFSSSDLTLPSSGKARWIEANNWILVGAGPTPHPTLTTWSKAIKNSGRPKPALKETWIDANLDLAQVARLLQWPANKPWPILDFTLAPRDSSLRTTGRLRFPDAITTTIPAWNIPTNQIQEPLVSFTAARGISPLLSKLDTLNKLQIKPLPNELYAVAQGIADSQLYLLFPLPDATNQVERMASLLPNALPPLLRQINMGSFAWIPDQKLLGWRGLPPIVTPNVIPLTDSGRQYALVELFPRLRKGPPPASLLAQLQRPNLVYYNWEITDPHLQQWLHLSQLTAFLTDRPQLRTNHLAFRWLRQVQPKLGNAVTEATSVSPREWTVTRKSDLGLTAAELVAFARWLESPSFPIPAVSLAPEPAPAGKKRNAAPPAPASR